MIFILSYRLISINFATVISKWSCLFSILLVAIREKKKKATNIKILQLKPQSLYLIEIFMHFESLCVILWFFQLNVVFQVSPYTNDLDQEQ